MLGTTTLVKDKFFSSILLIIVFVVSICLLINNTYTNTNSKQEKEDTIISSKKKYSLDLTIVAPEMREVVDTWLAYKKEKSQSYKPTGFKTFYKKFCVQERERKDVQANRF